MAGGQAFLGASVCVGGAKLASKAGVTQKVLSAGAASGAVKAAEGAGAAATARAGARGTRSSNHFGGRVKSFGKHGTNLAPDIHRYMNRDDRRNRWKRRTNRPIGNDVLRRRQYRRATPPRLQPRVRPNQLQRFRNHRPPVRRFDQSQRFRRR